MEMSEDLKKILLPYTTAYTQKLDEELSVIITKDIKAEVAQIHSVDGTSQLEAKRTSDLYYEFYNVIRQVHQNLYGDENGSSYKLPISQLIKDFNVKSVFDVLIDDRKLKEAFDNGSNVLGDEELRIHVSDVFKEFGVDLRQLTILLLEFYLREELIGILKIRFHDDEFDVINNQILLKQPIPIDIKYFVKYRPRKIDDLKDIAVESISHLKEMNSEQRRQNVMVIVFTDDYSDSFERLKYRFNSVIFEDDVNQQSSIVMIPATLSKLKEFKDELSKELNRLSGKIVDFNYEENFLQNGWFAPPSVSELSSVFVFEHDPMFGRTLFLKLPFNKDYLIEYSIDGISTEGYRTVLFNVVPYADSSFYIELGIVGRSQRYWLQIKEGDKPPHLLNGSNKEYVVYVEKKNVGNWQRYKIEVDKLFLDTFGKDGLKLQRIAGIRFKGQIKIGSVMFA